MTPNRWVDATALSSQQDPSVLCPAGARHVLGRDLPAKALGASMFFVPQKCRSTMLTHVRLGKSQLDCDSAASFSVARLLASDGPTRLAVGRSPDCAWYLNSAEFPLLVSREHAFLSRLGSSVSVCDNSSTNGTYALPAATLRLKRLSSRSANASCGGCISSLCGRRFVNSERLAPNVPRALTEGDVVSFGGKSSSCLSAVL